jgi:hypothetical protein
MPIKEPYAPSGMPQPDHDGQLTEYREVVLGVDTHKDFHVAAVVSLVGVLLGHRDFPASPAGYRQLVARARGHGRLSRAGWREQDHMVRP